MLHQAVPAGGESGGNVAHIRVAARRLTTRSRFVAALAAIAAMVLVAITLQVAALRRIDQERAAAEKLEDRLLLAVQLENALRRQFSHHPHAASSGVHAAAYADARREVATLVRQLSGALAGTEAAEWVTSIESLSAGMDRQPALLGSVTPVAVDTPAHPFAVERDMKRLFAFLGSATDAHRDAIIRGENVLHRLALGLIIATALLAVTLTLYLSRSVIRPLARLEAGVARIAIGQLDTRIDIRSPDEFGAVASQLNVIASRLKEHRQRLSRAESLAVIGHSTSAVVHELNSSLQVIIGYLSLNRDRVPHELAAHFRRIEEEARRSTEIVNGVLEMSRTPPEPSDEPLVDLAEVAEDVASATRLVLPRGSAEITVRGCAVGAGSRCAYHQIITNLTKNAADAAGPGGKVRIALAERGDDVEVIVDDSGPGVPPSIRDRMFEPFFTTKEGGTGLGLSICAQLAESLGGTLHVGRSDLGGARMTLRVPRAEGNA